MSDAVKIGSGYILTCLIWGSTWLAIRITLESFTPFISAGIRFTIASTVIYAIMRLRSVRLQTDSLSIRFYIYTGLFSFLIPFGLVYWAEQFVNSGLAAVLFAVYPFTVTLFTFLFLSRDGIDAYKITGMVIGFLGIVFIFSEGITFQVEQLLGMAAITGSAVMQAGVVVAIKKWGGHLHPLSMNMVPMMIAGLGSLLAGLLVEDIGRNTFTFEGTSAVLFLALFGSVVTFTTYYWLIKRVNLLLLSLIAFITPVVAIFLGWIIAGEQLSARQLFGTLLVLIGILISTFSVERFQRFTKFKRVRSNVR